MDFTMIQSYINPALLVLAIVLYFVGNGIKNSKLVADEYIPFILGALGIIVAAVWVFASTPVTNSQEVLMAIYESLTQGILCAAAPVYINQLIKQKEKLE